jgi:hypothetical protein
VEVSATLAICLPTCPVPFGYGGAFWKSPAVIWVVIDKLEGAIPQESPTTDIVQYGTGRLGHDVSSERVM